MTPCAHRPAVPRDLGLTLLEVVISLSILVVGLLGLIAAVQRAGDASEQAGLVMQQQLFGESVLEEAQRNQLTTLYALCGANGIVMRVKDFPGHPANPYPPGLVAVLQCRDPAVDASFLVDPASAGLLSPALVQVVRMRVRVLYVGNPDETNPNLLVPLPGSRVPGPLELVTYRIAS